MLILLDSPLCNEVVAIAGTDWEELATNEASLRLDETTKVISGELLRIGEDMLVIQDETGTATSLPIDKFTAMIGEMMNADPIEAHTSRIPLKMAEFSPSYGFARQAP